MKTLFEQLQEEHNRNLGLGSIYDKTASPFRNYDNLLRPKVWDTTFPSSLQPSYQPVAPQQVQDDQSQNEATQKLYQQYLAEEEERRRQLAAYLAAPKADTLNLAHYGFQPGESWRDGILAQKDWETYTPHLRNSFMAGKFRGTRDQQGRMNYSASGFIDASSFLKFNPKTGLWENSKINAEEIANSIKASNPKLKGEELDKLIASEITRMDSDSLNQSLLSQALTDLGVSPESAQTVVERYNSTRSAKFEQKTQAVQNLLNRDKDKVTRLMSEQEILSEHKVKLSTRLSDFDEETKSVIGTSQKTYEDRKQNYLRLKRTADVTGVLQTVLESTLESTENPERFSKLPAYVRGGRGPSADTPPDTRTNQQIAEELEEAERLMNIAKFKLEEDRTSRNLEKIKLTKELEYTNDRLSNIDSDIVTQKKYTSEEIEKYEKEFLKTSVQTLLSQTQKDFDLVTNEAKSTEGISGSIIEDVLGKRLDGTKVGNFQLTEEEAQKILKSYAGLDKRTASTADLLLEKRIIDKDGKPYVYFTAGSELFYMAHAVNILQSSGKELTPENLEEMVKKLEEQDKKFNLANDNLSTNATRDLEQLNDIFQKRLREWTLEGKYKDAVLTDREGKPITDQKSAEKEIRLRMADEGYDTTLWSYAARNSFSWVEAFSSNAEDFGESGAELESLKAFVPDLRTRGGSYNERMGVTSPVILESGSVDPNLRKAIGSFFVQARQARMDERDEIVGKINSSAMYGGGSRAKMLGTLGGVLGPRTSFSDWLMEEGFTDAFLSTTIFNLAPAFIPHIGIPYMLASTWLGTYNMPLKDRIVLTGLAVATMGLSKYGLNQIVRGASSSATTTVTGSSNQILNKLGLGSTTRSVALQAQNRFSFMSDKALGYATLFGAGPVGGLASNLYTLDSMVNPETGEIMWAQFASSIVLDGLFFTAGDLRSAASMKKGVRVIPKHFTNRGENWVMIQGPDGMMRTTKVTPEAVEQIKTDLAKEGKSLDSKELDDTQVLKIKSLEDSYRNNTARAFFGETDSDNFYAQMNKWLSKRFSEDSGARKIFNNLGLTSEVDSVVKIAAHVADMPDGRFIKLDGDTIRTYTFDEMADLPTVEVAPESYSERRSSILRMITDAPISVYRLMGDISFYSVFKKMVSEGELQIRDDGSVVVTKKGNDSLGQITKEREEAEKIISDRNSKERAEVRSELGENKDRKSVVEKLLGKYGKKKKGADEEAESLTNFVASLFFADSDEISVSTLLSASGHVGSRIHSFSIEAFMAMSPDKQKAILYALESGAVEYKDGIFSSKNVTLKDGNVALNFGNTGRSYIEKSLYILGKKLSTESGKLSEETEEMIVDFLVYSRSGGKITTAELRKIALEVYNKHAEGATQVLGKSRKKGIKEGSIISYDALPGGTSTKNLSGMFWRAVEDSPAPTVRPEDMKLPGRVLSKVKSMLGSLGMADESGLNLSERERFIAAANRIMKDPGTDLSGPIEQYRLDKLVKTRLEALETLPDEFVVLGGRKSLLGISYGGRSNKILRRNSSGDYELIERGKVISTLTESQVRSSYRNSAIGVKGTEQDLRFVTERMQTVLEATGQNITLETMKSNLLAIASGEGQFVFGDLVVDVKDFSNSFSIKFAENGDGSQVVLSDRAMSLAHLGEQVMTEKGAERMVAWVQKHEGLETMAGLSLNGSNIFKMIAGLKSLDENALRFFGITAEEVQQVVQFLESKVLDENGNVKDGALDTEFQFSRLHTMRMRSVENFTDFMDSFSHEFRHKILKEYAKSQGRTGYDFLTSEAERAVVSSPEFQAIKAKLRESGSTYAEAGDAEILHEIMAYGSNLNTYKRFFGSSKLTVEDKSNFVVTYDSILDHIQKEAGSDASKIISLLRGSEDVEVRRLADEYNQVKLREEQDEQNQLRTDSGGYQTETKSGPRRVYQDNAGETGRRPRLYSDGDEFTGTGVREISAARITVGDSPGEGGVTKASIRRTPGSDAEVQDTVPLKLLDLSDNETARAIAENEGGDALKAWARDTGYDGIFDSSKFDGSADYEVSLLKSLGDDTSGSLKMADEEVDNLLISPADRSANDRALSTGSGIYKLSNSTSVDLSKTRVWDVNHPDIHIQKDNGNPNLLHLNSRAMRAFDILEADHNMIQDPMILTGSRLSAGSAYPDRIALSVHLARELEHVINNPKSQKAPFIIPYAEGMKKVISEIAGMPYDQILRDVAKTFNQKSSPGMTLLHRKGNDSAPTLLHEGTHFTIMEHFGSHFGMKLFLANSRLNMAIGDATDIMQSPNSLYARNLNDDIRAGDGISAFDTAAHEIMATGVNKKDISDIGFDPGNNTHVEIFTKAYVEIFDTISKSVGEGTAAEIARYMDPELVEKIYEIYPDKDRNGLLFGRSRIRALQEAGERQIQAAAVRESEEGLPPGGISLKMADGFDTEFDALIGRLAPEGPTINGLPVNSKEVPWQVRRMFKDVTEGGFLQSKVPFEEGSYGFIANKMGTRLRAELKMSQDWLAQVESGADTLRTGRAPKSWWDKVAFISDEGEILLKKPYAWSKYTKPLNGEKLGSRAEAITALQEKAIQHARGQVTEFQSAIKWIDDNGLAFGYNKKAAEQGGSLKMSDDDIEYLKGARDRAEEVVLRDKVQGELFGNLDALTPDGVAGYLPGVKAGEVWRNDRGELFVNGKSVFDPSVPESIQYALLASGVELGNFDYPKFRKKTLEAVESRTARVYDQLQELKDRPIRPISTELGKFLEARRTAHYEQPMIGGKVIESSDGFVIRTDDPQFKNLDGTKVGDAMEGLTILREAHAENLQNRLTELMRAAEWVESNFKLNAVEVLPPDPSVMREVFPGRLRNRPLSSEDATPSKSLKMADEDIDSLIDRITNPNTKMYPAEALIVNGYDPVTRAPNKKFEKTGAAKGEQWLKMLLDTPGVKKEAIMWGVGAWLNDPENAGRIIKLSELREQTEARAVKITRVRKFEDIDPSYDPDMDNLHPLERLSDLTPGELKLIEPEILERRRLREENKKLKESDEWSLIGDAKWEEPDWFVNSTPKKELAAIRAKREEMIQKYGSRGGYLRAYQNVQDQIVENGRKIYRLEVKVAEKLGSNVTMRYGPEGRGQGDWWHGRSPKSPEEVLFSTPTSLRGRPTFDTLTAKDLPTGMEIYKLPSPEYTRSMKVDEGFSMESLQREIKKLDRESEAIDLRITITYKDGSTVETSTPGLALNSIGESSRLMAQGLSDPASTPVKLDVRYSKGEDRYFVAVKGQDLTTADVRTPQNQIGSTPDEAVQKYYRKRTKSSKDYHWEDDKNVVGWVRMQKLDVLMPDGKVVETSMMTEVQSPHQGRNKNVRPAEMFLELKQVKDELKTIDLANPDETERFTRLSQREAELTILLKEAEVDIFGSTTWKEIGAKIFIGRALEQTRPGEDVYIAITDADAQVRRYENKFRNRIDELKYEKVESTKIDKKLSAQVKLRDKIKSEIKDIKKELVSKEWDTFSKAKKERIFNDLENLKADLKRAESSVVTIENLRQKLGGVDGWRVKGSHEGKQIFNEVIPDKGSTKIDTHPEAMVPVSENISIRVFPDEIIGEMRKNSKGVITGDEIVVGKRFYEDIYERDMPSIMKKLFGAEFEEGRSRTFTPSPWKSQVEAKIKGRKVNTDKVLVGKIPAEKADQIRKGMSLAMAEDATIRFENDIYSAPVTRIKKTSGTTGLDEFESTARWSMEQTEHFFDPENKMGFTVFNFLKDGEDPEVAFARAKEELAGRPYVVLRGYWRDAETGQMHREISILVPAVTADQSAYYAYVGLVRGDQQAVIVSRGGETYLISKTLDEEGNVVYKQQKSRGRTRQVITERQYQDSMKNGGDENSSFSKTKEGNYFRFIEDFGDGEDSVPKEPLDEDFQRQFKTAKVVSDVREQIRLTGGMDPDFVDGVLDQGKEVTVTVMVDGNPTERKVMLNSSSVLDKKTGQPVGWVDDNGRVRYIDESKPQEKFNRNKHKRLINIEKADDIIEAMAALYIISNPELSRMLDALPRGSREQKVTYEAAKNAVLQDFELKLARRAVEKGEHRDGEFYSLYSKLMADEDIMSELSTTGLTAGKSAMSLLTAILSPELRVDANGVLGYDTFAKIVSDMAEGRADVDYSYVKSIFQLRDKLYRGKPTLELDEKGSVQLRKSGQKTDHIDGLFQKNAGRPTAMQKIIMASHGYILVKAIPKKAKTGWGRGRFLADNLPDGGEKPKTYAEIAKSLGIKIDERSKDKKGLYIKDPLLVEKIEQQGNPWLGVMEYMMIPAIGGDSADANMAGSNAGQKRVAILGEDIIGAKVGPFALDLFQGMRRLVYDINQGYAENVVSGASKREKKSDKAKQSAMAAANVQSKRVVSTARMQDTARMLSAETGEIVPDAVVQQALFEWVRDLREKMKSKSLTNLSGKGFEETSRILKESGMKIQENLPEQTKKEFNKTMPEGSKAAASREDDVRLNRLSYLRGEDSGSLMMADDADDPFIKTQRELVEADQKLADGDADTWIKLASRHVQGGVLSDGEISAIKRMAEKGDTEALNKYILGLSHITPLELVANLGRVTLLLGIKNFAKNVGGNSLRQMMEEISRMPAGVLDLVLIQLNSAMGGKNTERSVTGLLTDPVATLRAYKDAIAKGLPEGLMEAIDIMRGTNEEVIFEHPSLFRERSTGRFYLKPLEIIEKYGWRFQGAMDRPFNAAAYYRTLSELQTFRQREQAKLGNKISYEEAAEFLTVADQQFAEFEALRATFQENNPIASKYYELIDGLPAFWRSMANTITKFVKTPLNVMDYVLDYTGFWPLAKLAVKEYNTQDWVDWKRSVKNIMDNPQDRKVLSMAISKGAIGTLMFYIGSKMGAAGLISQFFDREEKKEGEQMEAKGTSFGEVVIGGKSIDISWLTPPAFYLIAGATAYQTTQDWYTKRDELADRVSKAKEGGDVERIDRAEQELAKHEKKSPAEQSFTRVLKNFALQTPFLRQGLELSTMLEQGGVVSGVTEKWFSPDVLVPQILSEIAATKDEYERAVTDESILARMQEKIQKKLPTLPGVSTFGKMLQDTNIPVVSGIGKTLTGREALPMKYDMFGRPIKSAPGVDPLKTKNINQDRLTQEFDKFNLTIPAPTGANPGEQNRLTKQKGEFFTPLLENLISTDEYNNSNDKVKKRILETAVRYISEEMRNPRLQPKDREFNLRALAFRENFRDTLRSNPTSLFKENLNINDRDVLSAFVGAGLEGQVSFAEVINDLKRSGNLDRFLNDRLASSLLVGKGRSRRDAERNFEQLTSNPIPALIEWWAVGKRNSMSRDRNDQRRDELREQGKTDSEIEKILRKESARRGATTRRELKSFNSITVTK